MAPQRLALAALLVVVFSAIGEVLRGAEAASTTTTTASTTATVLVSGQVPCSNGTSINVKAVAPFPNATVQLVCKRTVLTSVRTDVNGFFSTNLQVGNVQNQPNLLTALLANRCSAVVTTPLVACNASLADATGTLTAPLQIQGSGTASGTGGGGSGSGDLVTTLVGGPVTGIVGGIINAVTGLFSSII